MSGKHNQYSSHDTTHHTVVVIFLLTPAIIGGEWAAKLGATSDHFAIRNVSNGKGDSLRRQLANYKMSAIELLWRWSWTGDMWKGILKKYETEFDTALDGLCDNRRSCFFTCLILQQILWTKSFNLRMFETPHHTSEGHNATNLLS